MLEVMRLVLWTKILGCGQEAQHGTPEARGSHVSTRFNTRHRFSAKNPPQSYSSKSHFETSLNLFDLFLSEVLQRRKAQSVQQMIWLNPSKFRHHLLSSSKFNDTLQESQACQASNQRQSSPPLGDKAHRSSLALKCPRRSKKVPTGSLSESLEAKLGDLTSALPIGIHWDIQITSMHKHVPYRGFHRFP